MHDTQHVKCDKKLADACERWDSGVNILKTGCLNIGCGVQNVKIILKLKAIRRLKYLRSISTSSERCKEEALKGTEQARKATRKFEEPTLG
jgi:hypothetical protein